jgi:branched-chain amino acid transport system substrate-binding protein
VRRLTSRTAARVAGVLLAATMSLAIAACGGDDGGGSSDGAGGGGGGDSTEPIVIGAVLGLTGNMSFFDVPQRLGAEYAVEEINKAGGVLGRQLKLEVTDTKSDQAQTGSATLRLIDNGADFIIPSMDYDFGGPAARMANQNNKIAISTAGDPRFGLQGIGPLTFNTYSASPTEGATAAQFMVDKGWKKPYLLNDTSSNHSKTVCESFKKTWEEIADGPIGGEDIFQNDDQSISTQLGKLKDTPGVDAIMLCSVPPGGFAALRQIRAAKIDLPIVADAGFDGTYWLESAPEEDNMYILSLGIVPPGEDPDETRTALFEALEKETGEPATLATSVLTGHSAVHAFAKAIERAGTIETEKVAAELEKFKDEPLSVGPTTWTAECHVPVGRRFVMARINKEKVDFEAEVKPTFVPEDVC